jgi:hypothetical protein
VGGVFHKGLSLFYSGTKPGDVLEAAEAYIDLLLKDVSTKLVNPADLEYYQVLVMSMLNAYMVFYKRDQKGVKDTLVEQPFKIIFDTGVHKVPLVAVVDLLTKGFVRGSRKVWVCHEHKTGSALYQSSIDRLPMDFQICIYPAIVSRCLGEPLHSIWYNVCVKPRIRIKQNETKLEFHERLVQVMLDRPESYFFREEVLFDKRAETRTLNDLALIVDEMFMYHEVLDDEEIRDADHWYRNSRACFNYNKQCPFYRLCRYGETLGELKMFGQRKEMVYEDLIEEKASSD